MDCSEDGLDTIEAQKSTGESVPDFLINLRLSDLYNLHGEFVPMNPEIFSGMRAGDGELLEDMKSYKTPMACLKSDGGDSVLHLASVSGDVELVKNIISECPCLLWEPNYKYQIPLHVAARAGHSAVVEVLVVSITYFSDRLLAEDKERLNLYALKDINGDTPLHAALKDLNEKTKHLMYHESIGNKILMSQLISRWRNSKCGSLFDTSTSLMKTTSCLVNAYQRASFLANKDGKSPLYLAVEACHVSLVNAMLNRPGITSSLASQLEGRKSIIHAALKTKNPDVLDAILNEYMSLINELDEEGQTCLSVGASVGFYKGICKVLNLSPKSVYERNKDGSFAIHIAVEKGHEEVIKEILKRCPNSRELINKQGQNILHIAAKNGKVRFVNSDVNSNVKHLLREQDVDGNTPLHLATINWRPRSAFNLTKFDSTKVKITNIKNNDGLRPLDIAELNLRPEYVLRERLTLMVLLCVVAPRGVGWLPTSGMTLRSKSEHLGSNKFKDHINTLLLVAALVATVAFAAGFTLPSGFNNSMLSSGYNSSAPNIGMAAFAKDAAVFQFMVLDTLAMGSSIVAIIALIWAQLGDPEIVHKAFHLALPSLFIALTSMSMAFIISIEATVMPNISLTRTIRAISAFFYALMFFLLAPYVIPQVPGIPFLQRLTRSYLVILLLFVKEDDDDDDDEHYTSDAAYTRVRRFDESIGSPCVDQVENSKCLNI